MTMKNDLWFDSKNKWFKYISENMGSAVFKDSETCIIIKDNNGTTIAEWQNGNTGFVHETRSPERLERDRVRALNKVPLIGDGK